MTITENPILSSPNPLRNFYGEEYDKLKSSSTALPKKEKEEDSESFEEYSDEEESESFEEYSEEEEQQDRAKKEAKKSGKGEMVMRVKKDQKLSSKQLKMIESATQVRATSTNPLCKEKASMFRFVWHQCLEEPLKLVALKVLKVQNAILSRVHFNSKKYKMPFKVV